MNSNYANQVGARAKRNALIMATGTMKSKADVKKWWCPYSAKLSDRSQINKFDKP